MIMMRHLLQNRELKSEINIIPLLDVLLVLLLITMATASSTSQRIEVDLPTHSSQSKIEKINQEDQAVIIEIPEIGKYNIVISSNRVNCLSPERIISEIQNRMQLNPKTTFLIGGSRNIPYCEIIKVLNLLHSENVKSVGLMTQPI